MRIFSKWRDYYDSCIGHGFDPKIVYERHTVDDVYQRRMDVPNVLKPAIDPVLDAVYDLPNFPGVHATGGTPGVVVFCGRMYPYYGVLDHRYRSVWCYSVEEVVQALKARLAKDGSWRVESALKRISGEGLTAAERRERKWTRGFALSQRRKVLSPEAWKWYQDKTDLDIGVGPHLATETPVLEVRRDNRGLHLVRNPVLHELGFQRIVDSFTAFQSIAQYLGNDMAKQMDPDVDISDELRAESHGFDKWSFRRPPRKRR